ncbi:Deoxyribodipyrimidine photo-lyase [Planctomycetes bacterium Pan216]|uniref:Deoxyribodipyrimidine photo-lyase n=1 Tax=Kolteria novifilia TaxID=2527975 RepID=A0A518AYV1_9BACT|nr:Deoxyribodipyrimidine photo-lyase [Planctomycetes bacterium Pan216]
MTAIVWLRHDLRLADNPALRAAAESGAVVPVYIWDPEGDGDWSPGGASKWWWHHGLTSLDKSLRDLGSRLVVRQGRSGEILESLAKETEAESIHWNRRYEPAAIKRDSAIKESFKSRGIEVQSHNGSLLFEPWEVSTKSDAPYKVFSPFWRSCLEKESQRSPLARPQQLDGPEHWPEGDSIDSLQLEPQLDWADEFPRWWDPSEKGAQKELERFIEEAAATYKSGRNRMDVDGSSRLSPYLHFGAISPHQVWHAIDQLKPSNGTVKASYETYLSEIGWREFAHHLLYHFPHTTGNALRSEFDDFPWEPSKNELEAWQQGRTGVPLVDAAMRQLWRTGWMHNRARMVVASFLTKNLLIAWQEGAAWFWDTLVDADLANNTLGWQWTAGCGADAAPYFRIFNPVSQSEKHDPKGDYIRRWVPELEKLDTPDLFKPWEASNDALERAGVNLGETYPEPLVDLSETRKRALAAYDDMRGK